MGFMRKALFLGTGGLSGVAVRANSKKERTAKAAEKQVRLQKQMTRTNSQAVSETPGARAAAAAAHARAEALTAGATEAEGEATALQAAQEFSTNPESGKWAWRSAEGIAEDIARSNATIARIRATRQHAEPATKQSAAEDIASELGRLADLHGRGALTDDEFAAAKAKILGTKS